MYSSHYGKTALHVVLYSRVPGPITVLASPTISITILKSFELASGKHSTVYPLSFNTMPRPAIFKAEPPLQGQSRISFWRVKTPPVLITSPVSIVDPHSPGFGWIDTKELVRGLISHHRFIITQHILYNIPQGWEQG